MTILLSCRILRFLVSISTCQLLTFPATHLGVLAFCSLALNARVCLANRMPTMLCGVLLSHPLTVEALETWEASSSPVTIRAQLNEVRESEGFLKMKMKASTLTLAFL